ncbi:hypothetical protein ID866_11655 [Astraeus odoratus]|nr:hypothetical protein ID866_11655 [Astraeus odoratus]
MVDNVLDKRKISMDAKDILLDQALESSFNCDQCHAEFLTRKRLWGPTDWAYLRGYANPRVMWTLQKGYLSYNHREQYDFCTLWEEQPYETLIHEIFDHKTTAYDAWKKDDLLCMNCLCKFLQEHMHIWYLEWKRKRGAIPTEDCWYGYNCRTQQHNTAHAMKLNHYCEPIRGDAVQTSRTFVLDTVF